MRKPGVADECHCGQRANRRSGRLAFHSSKIDTIYARLLERV